MTTSYTDFNTDPADRPRVPVEYPREASAEEAEEAAARRSHLERTLPSHVTEVLRQIQRIGAVERAVDTILTDGFPALNQTYLPAVDAAEDGDWWDEDRTFTPTTPNVFVAVDEQESIRQKLIYLRGMLGLRSEGLTQCLAQLLKDAQTAGVSVPTTLAPVTPQDVQA